MLLLWIPLVLGLLYLVSRRVFNPPKRPNQVVVDGKYKEADNEKRTGTYYDVAIVGAGPSGACTAYYLRKSGRSVLLCEKKKFPRDKHCGDAVCKTGIEILKDMGLLDTLIKENKARVADSGGFVSPSGLSYIGRSHEVLGAIPAALAIKRTLLDEALAMKAKEVGADLKENSPVTKVVFDSSSGLWTVTVTPTNDDGEEQKEGKDVKTIEYQARVLVCADGATSQLARQLGIVKEAPNGTCSRAFVEGGTHQFKADGVIFYQRELLPGYAAIFKHPNDELNFCCYLIPGNPKVTNDDLSYWHEKLLKEHPFLVKALGSNYKIERMKGGALRLGGVPISYDEHLLVVGDAAGMIDPMTGEGIHHAMDGGRMAARFLTEALKAGNYSKETMREWHARWMDAFGYDFSWSMSLCLVTYRYPILLDAAAAAVARKGNEFLARWADIMTGRVPKIHLLKPEFAIVLGFELLLLLLQRLKGKVIGAEKKKEKK